MSWTEDRVSLLRKLWGEGHTAAEIAKQLGGVTRNAVIGKAHRMKLSNRVSPIQQNKKPTPAKAVERNAVPASAKEQNNTKKSVVEARVSEAPKAAVAQTQPKATKNSGELFDLMDLKPRQCRWPCGDPREDDFGFCGDHAMPGLPYCEEHAKIAYQAATRNRIFSGDKEVKAVQRQLQQKPEKKAASA